MVDAVCLARSTARTMTLIHSHTHSERLALDIAKGFGISHTDQHPGNDSVGILSILKFPTTHSSFTSFPRRRRPIRLNMHLLPNNNLSTLPTLPPPLPPTSIPRAPRNNSTTPILRRVPHKPLPLHPHPHAASTPLRRTPHLTHPSTPPVRTLIDIEIDGRASVVRAHGIGERPETVGNGGNYTEVELDLGPDGAFGVREDEVRGVQGGLEVRQAEEGWDDDSESLVS